MFKYLLPFMAGLVFTIVTAAQVPTDKTLLWKVTGNNISEPSYLYGTIHLMCPEDIIMPEMVTTAFNTCSSLYLEIDMNQTDLMQQAFSGLQMSDSNTLELLLDKNFDTVNQAFTKIAGISLQLLNKTKPMLLVSMLLPQMIGCMPDSWEKRFQTMATKKGVPISGLETIEDQMNVFDKIPYKEQADIFAKTILNLDSAKLELQKMLVVYKEKDIEKMHLMIAKDHDLQNFENLLLVDRNKNWIPVIMNQMNKMSTFFAFGAGHLGGPNGVISLLRKAGLTVTPIMY